MSRVNTYYARWFPFTGEWNEVLTVHCTEVNTEMCLVFHMVAFAVDCVEVHLSACDLVTVFELVAQNGLWYSSCGDHMRFAGRSNPRTNLPSLSGRIGQGSVFVTSKRQVAV